MGLLPELKIDDTVLPEEVSAVSANQPIYRQELLQVVYEQVALVSKSERGLPCKIDVVIGPKIDGDPKAELDWIVRQIKIGLLKELEAESVIQDYEINTEDVGDAVPFFIERAVIRCYPEVFLNKFSKLTGRQASDQVSYDQNRATIIFGSRVCPLPKGTMQDYFCQEVFKHNQGEKISESEILAKIDSFGQPAGIKNRRVYDLVGALNKKSKNLLGVDKLFSYENGYIIRTK